MKSRILLLLTVTVFTAHNAQALNDDWKTGKTGLVFKADMPTSDRLRGAKADVEKELKALGDVALELEQDIKEKIVNSAESTGRTIQKQEAQGRELCELGRNSQYKGVTFDGVTLDTAEAFDAKLRLLTAAWKSNKGTQQYFADKYSEYKKLNADIKQQANELDVLKQTLDNLLDPKKSPDSGSAQSAIQQAITGLDAGSKLRSSYKGETTDQIFAAAAEQNKTLTVTDADLSKIKETGDIAGALGGKTAASGATPTAKPWYQFW